MQTWTVAQQWYLLSRFFPKPAARVYNVVSDEGFVKSLMAFYNMTGDRWSTGSGSHYVDWSRGSASGSPGSFPLVALEFAPRRIIQVRLPCFSGRARPRAVWVLGVEHLRLVPRATGLPLLHWVCALMSVDVIDSVSRIAPRDLLHWVCALMSMNVIDSVSRISRDSAA